MPPPKYAYWLGRESLVLAHAVYLICDETPGGQFDALISPEHRTAEEWLQANVAILQVPCKLPIVVAHDDQKPWTTEGVRTVELMQALLSQQPLVWGRELIRAAAPRREKGEAHRRRERSMRRYLKETPHKVW